MKKEDFYNTNKDMNNLTTMLIDLLLKRLLEERYSEFYTESLSESKRYYHNPLLVTKYLRFESVIKRGTALLIFIDLLLEVFALLTGVLSPTFALISCCVLIILLYLCLIATIDYDKKNRKIESFIISKNSDGSFVIAVLYRHREQFAIYRIESITNLKIENKTIIIKLKGYFLYKGIEITYKGDILLPHTHGNNDYNEIIKAVSDVIDTDFIRSISRDDIKQFVMYMARRKVKASTRNRRLSAIRSFFEFCCNDVQIIDSSPCQTITNSKKEKKLPKYLTLEESEKLLASVKEGKNYDRNYCMLTLFLNCGLRLTELVDIDISDIQNDTLRIMGKGAKERILHLNESCMVALENWLQVRLSNKYFVKDKNALFISANEGTRLSRRAVQLVVSETLKAAGLDGKGYSTHKLRHTAATLMYQYGDVDVVTLKEVLGHEELSTTQIYTHIDNKQVREALEKNPLAHKNVDYIDVNNDKKGE